MTFSDRGKSFRFDKEHGTDETSDGEALQQAFWWLMLINRQVFVFKTLIVSMPFSRQRQNNVRTSILGFIFFISFVFTSDHFCMCIL